ncbi:MAG: hypothetical protein Fur0037_23100 [Planctomycetota bacterium]
MSQAFRVLLVEDDDALRASLDEFLACQGWSVRATASGPQAIRLAQRERFDFSILDFHLPGMTGLDVLRAISGIRPIPSILMSGMATREDALLAQAHGAFSFLRKPLDLAQLRKNLDLLIHHHFGGPVDRHPDFPPR